MATVDQYIAAAMSERGYTENPAGSNSNKFAAEAGHANKQPWCASFVVAIANRVGLELPSRSAYTPTLADGFRTAKRWIAGDGDPRIGDFVFFDWPGDNKNRIQHVGVVVKVNAKSINTIEGNTSADNGGSQDNGGGVFMRNRPRNNSIVGYGRPAYTTNGAAVPATNGDEDFMATMTDTEKQALLTKVDQIWNVVAAHGYVEQIVQWVQKHWNDPNTGSGQASIDFSALRNEIADELSKRLGVDA